METSDPPSFQTNDVIHKWLPKWTSSWLTIDTRPYKVEYLWVDKFNALKDDSVKPASTLIKVKNRLLQFWRIFLFVVSRLSMDICSKTETVRDRNISALFVFFVYPTVDHK